MNFPFGQNPKTRDCGFRCLYFVVKSELPYREWLKTLAHDNPEVQGLPLNHIVTYLNNHGFDTKFDSISEDGLFIVYSPTWLSTSGHYLVWDNGTVYDSTAHEPEKMGLDEFKSRIGYAISLRVYDRHDQNELG